MRGIYAMRIKSKKKQTENQIKTFQKTNHARKICSLYRKFSGNEIRMVINFSESGLQS